MGEFNIRGKDFPIPFLSHGAHIFSQTNSPIPFQSQAAQPPVYQCFAPILWAFFIFRFFPNLFYFSHENHRKITRKSQSPRTYFLAHSAILNKPKILSSALSQTKHLHLLNTTPGSSLLVFFTCCNHAHKMSKCEYSCNMSFAHKTLRSAAVKFLHF